MPVFVMIGRDGPRGLELRKRHREGHLGNLEKLDAAGVLRYAGPLLDPEGNPSGSVILFEADDLKTARGFFDSSDPYVVEGVFDSYEVLETRQVFPS